MKNKISLSLLLSFFSACAFASMPVITLTNNTNCEVVDYNFSHPQIVPAVNVYSFYYNNNNQLTYYAAIPANAQGYAPQSPIPNFSGTLGVVLGFSPDPNYTTGSFAGIGITSGATIIKMVITNSSCTKQSPCLDVEGSNPCNNIK